MRFGKHVFPDKAKKMMCYLLGVDGVIDGKEKNKVNFS